WTFKLTGTALRTALGTGEQSCSPTPGRRRKAVSTRWSAAAMPCRFMTLPRREPGRDCGRDGTRRQEGPSAAVRGRTIGQEFRTPCEPCRTLAGTQDARTDSNDARAVRDRRASVQLRPNASPAAQLPLSIITRSYRQ